jgi:DNA-binding NtrC family response regulator
MRNASAAVYVVDDDVSVRESVQGLIRSANFTVETFASARELLDRCRDEVPGCLVLDVNLPGLTGLDVQQELASAEVHVPIIFITGHGDVPTSVRAMKSGALEFLTKPLDTDALLAAIRQGIARSLKGASARRKAPRALSEAMVGESPAFKAVIGRVAMVAPTDSTVLILGETGTGKERVAHAIHARSHRSARPILSINCAAIQPSLIASELFGHERGAFTGALHQRLGRFELAEGGTIFLDEIGDLPAETQIALLRVLQEREFERVGGNQRIRADVRVIAATHCDLRAAIAEGSFRNDLFYRLNVFPIHVPPLRERPTDIPLLIDHFLRTQKRKLGREVRGLDEKTLEMMRTCSWPGNVRELQNVIERWAIVSGSSDVLIDESWFAPEATQAAALDREQAPDGTVNFREYLETVERNLIGRAMTAAGGNQSEAARRLGLSRGSLLERLRKYGRRPPDDRASDKAVQNRSAPLNEQAGLRRST